MYTAGRLAALFILVPKKIYYYFANMDITIPINRKEVPIPFFILLTGTVFFTFSLFSDDLGNSIYRAINTILLLPAIIILLCLTVLSLVDYMKALFDKNAALHISGTGITDNLSIFSCGAMPWTEIIGVEIRDTQIARIKVLLIHLSDTTKYIDGKNFFVRRVLKAFTKKWNTPVVISSRRVNYDLQELKELIVQRIQ